mgnify:CR=1 FL=1
MTFEQAVVSYGSRVEAKNADGTEHRGKIIATTPKFVVVQLDGSDKEIRRYPFEDVEFLYTVEED